VHEALIYSNSREIELLPALPDDWQKGSLHGTAARCRCIIDTLTWDIPNGKVTVKITSNSDGNTIKLSCKNSLDVYVLTLNKNEAAIKEFRV